MGCKKGFKQSTPIIDRFNEKYIINPETGCWDWQDTTGKRGYGKIRINGKHESAHRVSYELFIGKIPDGMMVCHTCDRPCCVSPFHLFAGTASDNQQDSISKGRHRFQIYPPVHPSAASYVRGCRCEDCMYLYKITLKEYKDKNREKINKTQMEYKLKNWDEIERKRRKRIKADPEKHRDAMRKSDEKRRKGNPGYEKAKAGRLARYEKNKDEICAKIKQWRLDNPEKIKEANERRKAKRHALKLEQQNNLKTGTDD